MSLALTCQYLLPNSHIYKALGKVSLLPYNFFLCNDTVQVQIHRQSLCKENSYDGIIISFHLNEEWSWIFLHSCEYMFKQYHFVKRNEALDSEKRWQLLFVVTSHMTVKNLTQNFRATLESKVCIEFWDFFFYPLKFLCKWWG